MYKLFILSSPVEGMDFTLPSMSVIIMANTSNTTVVVDITSDTILEGDEDFTVEVESADSDSNLSMVNTWPNPSLQYTILDDTEGMLHQLPMNYFS